MDASLETLLAHRAWVRALAAALVGPSDAEDLEQEAWLAAVEGPPHDGTPRAWLATVLRRTASKMRRSLIRRTLRERAAARPEVTAPAADLVARAETHERVVRAVLALPEPYRSTILLRFFEGLAPREIAHRTGTPIDTVKARLRRGLERLRADLPEDRAWGAALLALAVPRRAPSPAVTLKVAAAVALIAGSLVTFRAFDGAPAPAHAALALVGEEETDSGGTGQPLSPGTDDVQAAEAAAPGAPSLPVTSRAFLVRGVVHGARSFIPYAVAEVAGERRLLGAVELSWGADGAYAVQIPLLGEQAQCEIDFGVTGYGFVRQARRIVVAPGGEYQQDFVVEPGVGIAGSVTDPDGRPVAGLMLFAVAAKTPPNGFMTGSLPDLERLVVSQEHFAQWMTDALGRFEVQGLVPGAYGLHASSEEWILDPDPLAVPEGNACIMAFPAHAVTGTLRDARTGEPVATASVSVDLRTATGWCCTRTASVRNGQISVVWKPYEPEIEEGFDAMVRVEAAGYRTAARVLAFPQGTRRVSIDLLLDRAESEPLPLLRIEVTSARGQMVEAELSCALAATDDPARHPVASEFHAVARGLFELRAPPGRWSIRLAPRQALGEPLEWSGIVEMGRDERVRCSLPPFGIVRVRRPRSGSWIAMARTPGDSRSYSWHADTSEVRLAAVPGEWKVTGFGEGQRTVVVLEGTETVVDLD